MFQHCLVHLGTERPLRNRNLLRIRMLPQSDAQNGFANNWSLIYVPGSFSPSKHGAAAAVVVVSSSDNICSSR